MIRGDNAICGTTTTGTGTLTLAACPTPPGGIDFDVLLRAMGFGNNNVQIVSYTLIEYTDATFAMAKSHEKGFGTLTLGSSVGIANCTLARTLKQSVATSLNSQPATQSFMPGTGITIGTAANTLVFLAPSVMDIQLTSPFYDSAGLAPHGLSAVGMTSGSTGQNVAWDKHHYTLFDWRVPMLVKRCSFATWGGFTGTTNAYAALYAIGMDGKPGRLLIDFGILGVPGSSLNVSFSQTSSALHPTGFLMLPGEYYLDFCFNISPAVDGTMMVAGGGSYLVTTRAGTWMGSGYQMVESDASGPLTPAPNPAYIGGYTVGASNLSDMMFTLAET